MRPDQPLLSVVVPCFNEEAVLPEFHRRIVATLVAEPGLRYEIVLVNDGSTDGTLTAMRALQEADKRVRVIDLTRNFGKEAALTAAIDEARGDVVVPIDADLQDPPSLIPLMVEKWRQGADVVLARRADRSTDSLLKRQTARWFYRIHNRLAEPKLPEDVGDFRLMDRRVVEALKRMPERRRFMKGMFAWVGFPSATIEYDRDLRAAGKTKFSGWRLWNLAIEGVTSFSTAPLRIWTYLGFSIALTAFLYATVIIGRTLIHGVDVPGYASLLTVVLLLGGIQMVGIGVVGEYVGRIYLESKQRPVYLIRERYES